MLLMEIVTLKTVDQTGESYGMRFFCRVSRRCAAYLRLDGSHTHTERSVTFDYNTSFISRFVGPNRMNFRALISRWLGQSTV